MLPIYHLNLSSLLGRQLLSIYIVCYIPPFKINILVVTVEITINLSIYINLVQVKITIIRREYQIFSFT